MVVLETVGFILLATLALGFGDGRGVSQAARSSRPWRWPFNLVAIAGLLPVAQRAVLALLQVIVYAGAIMVLILFVIMLLSISNEPELHRSGVIQRVMAPLLALGCAAAMGFAVYRGSEGFGRYVVSSTDFGTVRDIGTDLFTTFFYAFEAISLLLVVAMIGAVLLAKRRL